jgi:hypothetical protein
MNPTRWRQIIRHIRSRVGRLLRFRRARRPRAIVFFLPLPEPLPFPHGEVFSFLDEKHPGLAGLTIQQTPETSPLPEDAGGRIFTSLRFWQRLIDMEDELERQTQGVDAVVRSIVPAEDYAGLREHPVEGESARGEEEDAAYLEVAQREVLRSFDVPGEEIDALIESGPPRDYQTIVEAVTPLVEVEGPLDPVSAAFDRCVDRLAQLASSYRRAAHQPIARITRERLPLSVYYVTYEMGHPKANWSHGLFLAHMSAPEVLVLPPATPEQVEDIKRHLAASLQQHPLTPYVDRVVDAEHALRQGDTANAVVLAQVGAEIFLDAVLGLLVWEEGASPKEGAEREFASDLTPRVRNSFAPRLGGDWNLKGAGPVGDWKRKLYELRGRVIHGGYEPSRDETRQAFDSLAALEEFCKTRVLEKRNRFPRTALIVLGPDGLVRRAGWGRRIREFAEQNQDNNWLENYNTWRAQVSAQ